MIGQDTTGSEARGVRGEGRGNVNANPLLWPSGRRQASECPPLTSAILIATCRLEFGVSHTKQTAGGASNRDKTAIGRFVVHANVAARFLRPELPVGTAFRRARFSNGPDGITQRRRPEGRRYISIPSPPRGADAVEGRGFSPAVKDNVRRITACAGSRAQVFVVGCSLITTYYSPITAFLIADPRLEFALSRLQPTTSKFLIGSKQGGEPRKSKEKAKSRHDAGATTAQSRRGAGATNAGTRNRQSGDWRSQERQRRAGPGRTGMQSAHLRPAPTGKGGNRVSRQDAGATTAQSRGGAGATTARTRRPSGLPPKM